MLWYHFTSIVVIAATGIHFFAKLAKGTLDPLVALVITMTSALFLALCFLPFAQESIVKATSSSKGILLYMLVGFCITIAHVGIFYMFKTGAPISLATPIARFVPAILAVFLGVFFFHETLKPTQIIGLIMAAGAVILIIK